MTQALSFSEVFDRSYKATLGLLKTYIVGAFVLIVLSFLFRGLGSVIFIVLDMPVLSDNLALTVAAGIIGIACLIVSVVLQIMMTMYALVVAVDRTTDIKAGIRKTWRYLWKLMLGGIWIYLRSFAWISLLGLPFVAIGAATETSGMLLLSMPFFFVGAICAIASLPLLLFTNIIQLQEGTGVRASATLSLARAQGYWGKIVGNNILMSLSVGAAVIGLSLVVILCGVVVGMLAPSLGRMILVVSIPLGIVGVFGTVIAFAGATLFMRMFLVELYETIKANPRAVA